MTSSTFHSRTGRTFTIGSDRIEVTGLRRPDEGWVYVDPAGHEHRWQFTLNGVVLNRYDPRANATVPTVRRVVDGLGYWEDGESYEISHDECAQCGALVEPRSKADDTRRFIQGLRYYSIDGEPVSEDAFKMELLREHPEFADKLGFT